MLSTVKNILLDRSVKQNRFLGYQRDLFSQLFFGKSLDRSAVHENVACGWAIKTQKKRCDRRLAATGFPHQCNRLPRLDFKRCAVERPPLPAGILEYDFLKGDGAGQHLAGINTTVRLLRLVYQAEHTPGSRQASLNVFIYSGETLYWTHQQQDCPHIRYECPCADKLADRIREGKINYSRHPCAGDQKQHGNTHRSHCGPS